MRNYYYLVASLPQLSPFDDKNVPAFLDAVSDIEDSVHPDDREFIDLIRLPFDNANLITILASRNRSFDPRGNYPQEDLSAGVRNPGHLPEYMQLFLQARRDNRASFSGRSDEDQLNLLLYEEITQKRSGFIADWFSFEMNLRNIVTGINNRRDPNYLNGPGTDRELSLPSVLIGRDEVAEAILRSSASDFGLSTKIDWIERVIAAFDADLFSFERSIDTLRWDMLDEMTLMSYFTIDVVIAFLLKLLIIERWKRLDAQVGRANLDRMVKQLTVTVAQLHTSGA
jgi:hypothetical protein